MASGWLCALAARAETVSKRTQLLGDAPPLRHRLPAVNVIWVYNHALQDGEGKKGGEAAGGGRRRQAAVPGGLAMQAQAGVPTACRDDPRAGELGRGLGAQQATACSREGSGLRAAQWQHPCLVVIEGHLCGGCKLLKRAEATTGCAAGLGWSRHS